MTTVSLKTGEVVQVEDILEWIDMTEEEFANWEASHLGKHEFPDYEDEPEE